MNSKKKRYVSAWQAEGSRMDVPGSCNYHDRDHELLSNDTCIYHFPADRSRSKYEICRSDLQQL